MKNPPAFQFYPSDFLGDPAVIAMSSEERGVYMTLLCVAWMEGGIPSDLNKVRRLLRLPTKRFDRIWEGVSEKWESDGNGRLTNPRMELVRKERQDFSKKARAAAKVRWAESERNANA